MSDRGWRHACVPIRGRRLIFALTLRLAAAALNAYPYEDSGILVLVDLLFRIRCELFHTSFYLPARTDHLSKFTPRGVSPAIMSSKNSQKNFAQQWKQISRRIRVPLGFLFVALYFWLARPVWESLLAGLVLIVPGLFLRGYASGYVKKNAELTTTGPYAYTRNPLYLGSIMIAFGFALAARSIWIAVVLAVLFGIIYLPVIFGEEEYLRAHFSDYDEYARRVPRLLPRLRVRSAIAGGGKFSVALYRKHREYNSLLGSICIYLVLIARLVFVHHS